MNARRMLGGGAAMAVPAVALALACCAVPPATAQQGLSALQIDVDAVTRTAQSSVVLVSAEHMLVPRGVTGAAAKPRPHTRVGSGVAIAEDEIVTTASVASGATHITVTASNGLQSEADIVGVDEVFNLALLRLKTLRLPALHFTEGRTAQPGDWVIALGRTYGMRATQSVGYVSFRYREPAASLLQTTNTVYPGNSGGAALNPRGELIGVIQGELSSRDAIQLQGIDERDPSSVSFVLPAEVVGPVIETLRRDGRVPHGWLGVSTSAASVPSDSRPGTDVPIGATVVRVTPGGVAERAGLRAGDLIVGFEQDRVEFPAQLARWVSTSKPGTTVQLVWVRDDLQHSARVTLTESPWAAPQWATASDLAPRNDSEDRRIADLERRIQELNRELESLKNRKPPQSLR
jgi:serine protease Do